MKLQKGTVPPALLESDFYVILTMLLKVIVILVFNTPLKTLQYFYM